MWRLFHSISRWSRTIMEPIEFSMCLPDKTLYFSRVDESEADTMLSGEREITSPQNKNTSTVMRLLESCFVTSTSKVYIVQLDIDYGNDSKLSAYVHSCLGLHPLYRWSKSNPAVCFGLASARLDRHDPLVRGHLTRILCCSFNDSAGDLSQLQSKLSINDKPKMYQLEPLHIDNFCKLTSISGEENDIATVWKLRADPAVVSGKFNNEDISPVFHEIDRALSVLKTCNYMKEVEELLQIYERECSTQPLPVNLKFPFVVVEGLDATGKTTITETLQKKLGAVRYCTPPPLIQHLRKHFTSLPEIVSRAYYEIGNLIVSQQISQECQNRPVIMDRYWHSTAAYAIANESSKTDIPPVGHSVYKWPPHLVKPNIVLFLTVTEETRKIRLAGRQEAMTFEEQVLSSDLCFRERLHTAYKRFDEPKCVEIDANGSIKSVEENAVTALTEHGINFN